MEKALALSSASLPLKKKKEKERKEKKRPDIMKQKQNGKMVNNLRYSWPKGKLGRKKVLRKTILLTPYMSKCIKDYYFTVTYNTCNKANFWSSA